LEIQNKSPESILDGFGLFVLKIELLSKNSGEKRRVRKREKKISTILDNVKTERGIWGSSLINSLLNTMV